jgi:hypothetical protein
VISLLNWAFRTKDSMFEPVSQGTVLGQRGKRLAEAQFCNECQALFLRQAILEDAGCAQVIDELNLMLHR